MKLILVKTDEQGSPHGLVAKVLNCKIVVSEFKLQDCYYVHFWINTLGKGMNLLIPTLSYGLYRTTTVLLKEWLWH